MQTWLEQTVARWADRDRRWAQAMHRIASSQIVVLTLMLASRSGDGPLWYALIAALPLFSGMTGAACAVQMLGVGMLNLAVYRYVKRRVCRPRPFVACPGIRACTGALDCYSFPSGHTLHAVSFAFVLSYHYPAAALVAGPFVVLIAVSRIVLGLHYPSDVAVGALIGVSSAAIVLAMN